MLLFFFVRLFLSTSCLLITCISVCCGCACSVCCGRLCVWLKMSGFFVMLSSHKSLRQRTGSTYLHTSTLTSVMFGAAMHVVHFLFVPTTSHHIRNNKSFSYYPCKPPHSFIPSSGLLCRLVLISFLFFLFFFS